MWISPGLDTFRSVAPNWSPLRRAFAPKRNEEEEEKRKTKKEGEGGMKGRTNRKDKTAGREDGETKGNAIGFQREREREEKEGQNGEMEENEGKERDGGKSMSGSVRCNPKSREAQASLAVPIPA